MMRTPSWLMFASTLALTACVSDRYQAAPKTFPRAVILNLAAVNGPIHATLHSVVVFEGPGSWKLRAYWDEYVLSIHNAGPDGYILEDATLTDRDAVPFRPGTDPWVLEHQSLAWWKRVSSIHDEAYGPTLELGAVLAVAAGSAATSASLVAASAVLVPTIVVLPGYLIVVTRINDSNRKEIGREFERRRLKLPLTIAPGSAVQGSLFFPITPGPRRLSLHGRRAGQAIDTTLELQPLAGLHLKGTHAGPGPVSP